MSMSALGCLLLGVVLGYLIGWHRGVLRLTLLPNRRSSARPGAARPTSASSAGPTTASTSGTPGTDGGNGLPDRRSEIRQDLERAYPHATAAQLDAGLAEIEAQGRAMFAGRPRRTG